MPLWANACVKLVNFAPCKSYSGRISSGRVLGSSFSAPSFANLSPSSFPRLPLWPFTHSKKVGAVQCLRR